MTTNGIFLEYYYIQAGSNGSILQAFVGPKKD